MGFLAAEQLRKGLRLLNSKVVTLQFLVYVISCCWYLMNVASI